MDGTHPATVDPELAAFFAVKPQAVRCPFPALARLQQEAPVTWVPEIEAFVVSRYDDVVAVLRRPEVFSSRTATGQLTARQLRTAMAELAGEDPEIARLLHRRAEAGQAAVLLKADPPDHTRQRSLVNRAFTPASIRRLEPEIERIVDELLAGFVGTGTVEFVSQFAVPLPVTVIAAALQVPVERMADFKRWSDAFGAAVGNHGLSKDDLRRVLVTQAEFFSYFGEVVAERIGGDGDDLISVVAAARSDGERLRPAEILEMVAQFLVAGNETTTKLLASAARHLAEQPALAARLRAAPERIPAFVEEVLRLETPAMGMFREANVDTSVGGVDVPAGASLWLLYGAANRDPAHFGAADACDLARESAVPHLAFGFGTHFCLGAPLSRAEARIALTRLVARCRDLALAVPADEILYEESYMLRGIRRLPLTFTPVS